MLASLRKSLARCRSKSFLLRLCASVKQRPAGWTVAATRPTRMLTGSMKVLTLAFDTGERSNYD